MLDELLNMYLAVFQIQLNLGQFEEAQNLAQKKLTRLILIPYQQIAGFHNS